MGRIFSFYLLSRILGNPIVALIVLLVIYAIIDRRFVGLMPDIFRPLRRAGQLRRLREQLRLNPADANVQLELGSALRERGRLDEAVTQLEAAAHRLDTSQALFQLGAAYITAERWEEGKEALEKALRMNPRVAYGEPYLYLARYNIAMGLSVSDVAGLDEVVSHYGSVRVCYALGRLFEQGGDAAKAKAMYAEALATHRVNPPFLRRQERRAAWASWWRLRFVAKQSRSSGA